MNTNDTNAKATSRPLRLAYRPPSLVRYGQLGSQTLGGSVGTGDSGNPTTFAPRNQ
jgi:hypothetical protein